MSLALWKVKLFICRFRTKYYINRPGYDAIGFFYEIGSFSNLHQISQIMQYAFYHFLTIKNFVKIKQDKMSYFVLYIFYFKISTKVTIFWSRQNQLPNIPIEWANIYQSSGSRSQRTTTYSQGWMLTRSLKHCFNDLTKAAASCQ